MKSVVICGSQASNHASFTSVCTIEIEDMPITVGLMETKEPTFDGQAPENRLRVLVKVHAFSCNYRDKSVMLTAGQKCREGARYSCIGSEFVGEIIAIGSDVTMFQAGERVMADHRFPYSGVPGLPPGIPTDCASKRYRIMHEAKLIKVPPEMPNEVAAAFSLGAQTAYSMIRKLRIETGRCMLVTAATSNTSLFVIQALRQYALDIYATTTSHRHEHKLIQMGLKEVIPIDATLHSLREHERIKRIIAQSGGFNYVIDPFFDLYLNKVLHTITMEGKYIFCGLADQCSHLTGKAFQLEKRSLRELMTYLSYYNVQLLGNCLGQTEDLRRAIADYTAGTLNVTIDKVFRGDQVAAFFDRTYNSQDRFGKVVYCYDD